MRAKGEGTIQKIFDKDGKLYGYKGALVIGYNDKKNPIRKTFRGKTQREVRQRMEEYRKGIEIKKKPSLLTEQDITLEEFAYRWIFEIRYNTLKPSSIERYEGLIRNYIKDTVIGKIKLSDLKSKDLDGYYNELRNSDKSENTIKGINKTIKSILEDGIREEYIGKNVAKGRGLIKTNYQPKQKELAVFTEEEQEKLIAACKGHRLEALFLVALGTGIRQGELLGLTWDDVDFEKELISINKSVKKVKKIAKDGSGKYTWIEQTPKTQSSIRNIPVPSPIMKALELHKRNQDIEKVKYHAIYLDSNFVFCTNIGLRIDARNLQRAYSRLLKKHEIKYRKFHSLRHTYATRLYERGVEAKKVQLLMGHSDIATTMNIYTHIRPETLEVEVAVLDSLFK